MARLVVAAAERRLRQLHRVSASPSACRGTFERRFGLRVAGAPLDRGQREEQLTKPLLLLLTGGRERFQRLR
jgi:hypothetical protein